MNDAQYLKICLADIGTFCSDVSLILFSKNSISNLAMLTFLLEPHHHDHNAWLITYTHMLLLVFQFRLPAVMLNGNYNTYCSAYNCLPESWWWDRLLWRLFSEPMKENVLPWLKALVFHVIFLLYLTECSPNYLVCVQPLKFISP